MILMDEGINGKLITNGDGTQFKEILNHWAFMLWSSQINGVTLEH